MKKRIERSFLDASCLASKQQCKSENEKLSQDRPKLSKKIRKVLVKKRLNREAKLEIRKSKLQKHMKVDKMGLEYCGECNFFPKSINEKQKQFDLMNHIESKHIR